MDMRRKLALMVVASFLLTAIPASVLVYRLVQSKVLRGEIDELLEMTRNQAELANQRLLEGQPKLLGLSRLLQVELAKPIQPEEIKDFHRQIELNADGVWRNRRPPFDGSREAGLFLPVHPKESDTEKVMHLRIKRIIDVFGSAASKPMENVWYLSLNRSEIIFDSAFPNFTFDLKADNDFTTTPSVSYSSPELNPRRQFGFTPPLFNRVSKEWMVSAIYPLYLGDRWIGTVGEDMRLSSVMDFLFNGQQLHQGAQCFLIDGQNNFIVGRNLQQALEGNVNASGFDWGDQPQLKSVLQMPLAETPTLLSERLMVDGRGYVAIGINLQPVNWRYIRLMPIDEILAPTRKLFPSLLAISCLVSLASGLIIYFSLHRNFVRRIRLLANVMRLYEIGDKQHAQPLLPGNDEISEAAREFDVMIDGIANNLVEIQATGDKLRISEERLKFAIDGSGDGVWDWDLSTGQAFYSMRWKQILGYGDDEFPNLKIAWERQLHPDDFGRVMRQMNAYLQGNEPHYADEFRMLHKVGEWRWILARGTVVRRDETGKPIRVIGTHTDITERKQMEFALQQAKEAAEALSRSKSAFLDNMSQEIRTPMNAIIGFSQLALNKDLSADVRDYLKKITRASESLLGIINDILDFSKIEAGKLNIENTPFNLISLLNSVHNLFYGPAEEKGLIFSIDTEADIPTHLVGDALRIQQVLANLLSNAIKFTESGKVSLRLHLLERRGQKVRLLFRVIDSGIGMDIGDRAKLFSPFSQVDDSIPRRFGGTGLGLAISRSLLQLMGSDFSVDSTVGSGTTFGFELLLAIDDKSTLAVGGSELGSGPHQSSGLADKLTESARSLQGCRILIAEDNPINQQVVKEFLRLSGMEVDIANNGKEALKFLEQKDYAAVLMDVHMPEMAGFEATQRIRQQSQWANLPIIALSAGVTAEERGDCLACGMNDFVPKPIDPEQLIKALSQAVSKINQINVPEVPVANNATEPSIEQALQVLVGFDFELALSMVGDDTELLVELLLKLHDELRPAEVAIQQNVNDGHFDVAHRLVHSIKSSAGYLGANVLQDAARALEVFFLQGETDAEAFEGFCTILKSTLAELVKFKAALPIMSGFDGQG